MCIDDGEGDVFAAIQMLWNPDLRSRLKAVFIHEVGVNNDCKKSRKEKIRALRSQQSAYQAINFRNPLLKTPDGRF